ncbi:hypothetical protein BPSOL_1250 [Bifidobacterium pseudolongum]|nr:hypothetical protein BPSOL_1250 [Bifidobacterium pseudolongum]
MCSPACTTCANHRNRQCNGADDTIFPHRNHLLMVLTFADTPYEYPLLLFLSRTHAATRHTVLFA